MVLLTISPINSHPTALKHYSNVLGILIHLILLNIMMNQPNHHNNSTSNNDHHHQSPHFKNKSKYCKMGGSVVLYFPIADVFNVYPVEAESNEDLFDEDDTEI